MALTVNNYFGSETGGGEEASAVSGSADFDQTTVVRSGSRAVAMVGASTIQFTIDIDDGVASAGDDHIVGFGFHSTDLSPGTATRLFTSNDQGIRLSLDTNGDVLVQQGVGNTVATVLSPFTVDTWHYIELYWQNLDSGNVELFIDDSSVASGTDDFRGGADVTGYVFRGPGSGDGTYYFDDCYILTGATAASDRLGDAEVFMYQNTAEDATDQGDTLADGTWALVSETPLNEGTANDAQYVDTGNLTGSTICDEGTRSGPSGDANVDGDSNIKAAKFVGRFKRSTGGGREHKFLHGNSGDGVTASADMGLSTAYATKMIVSEAAAIMPLSTESFQHGFSKSATAGQDIFCGDIWAMLLHVPSAGGASGAGALTLATIVISGTGGMQPDGTGALALSVPSINGTGVAGIDGSGALALGVPAISGTGAEEFTATGALALGAPSIAGTGAAEAQGTGALLLAVPSIAGAGIEEFTGAGALLLAVPAIAGTGIEVFTATGTLTLSVPSIAGTGVAGADGVGALALGPPLIAGTAVEEFIASGALALAVPSIAGTGSHTEGADGTGALVLGTVAIAGTGIAGADGVGALLLAVPSISGSGLEEFIGSGALTIPGLAIAGIGVEEFIASGALTIAVIVISGTGESVIVLTSGGSRRMRQMKSIIRRRRKR